MNENEIVRLELCLNNQNLNYKIASLNCDKKTNEFFYHFAYQKESSKKLWYINEEIIKGRPDHISFHKDGFVHLTLKDDNSKLNRHQMHDQVFLPTDNNLITPLLMHSLYPIDGKYILPFSLKSKVVQEFVKRNSASPFSVVIFLTPEHIHLNDYQPVCRLGSIAGRFKIWDGWCIDYMQTDLILPLTKKEIMSCPNSSFQFTDLNKTFYKLCP